MKTNLRQLKRSASVAKHIGNATRKSWAEQHAPLAAIVAAYSTLAAVIVAGFGFYYTVIPLYQKAAVDEQLARREAELKQLEVHLVRARTQAYELGRARVLNGLAIAASVDCAGGRLQISQPGQKSVRSESDLSLEERMAQSVSECLSGFTNRAVKSKRLTEADLNKLREASNALGAELDQKRLDALKKIQEIPAAARRDERILEASTIDRRYQEIAELAEPYWSPEQRASSKERWFQAHVQSVQRGLAAEYWSEASAAIHDLYGTDLWPRTSFDE